MWRLKSVLYFLPDNQASAWPQLMMNSKTDTLKLLKKACHLLALVLVQMNIQSCLSVIMSTENNLRHFKIFLNHYNRTSTICSLIGRPLVVRIYMYLLWTLNSPLPKLRTKQETQTYIASLVYAPNIFGVPFHRYIFLCLLFPGSCF